MRLSEEYLKIRYDYWREEICKVGIWDSSLFGNVLIQVRKRCKSYNGIFSRKWIKKNGERVLIDKIVVYNNIDDFNPNFIDNVLVHEMIHQYIIQNKIKDSSTHGKVFKTFMKKINLAFPNMLSINVKDHNPSVPVKGPGLIIHNIILAWTEKDCYCCVIHPKRLMEFDRLLKGYKKSGSIKSYSWAQSVDVHFNQYVRCMKRLHGIKKNIEEMNRFCEEYNVIQIGEKWLTLRKA